MDTWDNGLQSERVENTFICCSFCATGLTWLGAVDFWVPMLSGLVVLSLWLLHSLRCVDPRMAFMLINHMM